MLSILIPVYNQSVEEFIKELQDSAIRGEIQFEIVIADDGSNAEYDQMFDSLALLENVKILRNKNNKGRSAIRNQLAQHAQYESLLFLDADGSLKDNKFIYNYKNYLDSDVVYGGRLYPSSSVIKKDQYLHYRYGMNYESQNSAIRTNDPYRYFHSNNFLVRKSILLKYPFHEDIIGYGYEDLLWAEQLKNNNVKIINIDNPVIHLGLESADVFLNKVLQSLKNLVYIRSKYKLDNVSLLRLCKRLESARLDKPLMVLFNFFKKSIYSNLLSNNPSLYLLQLFKLGSFLELISEQK